MKSKILVTLLLAAVSMSWVHGQSSADQSQYVRKNDIMLDPIFLIAAPALNMSYERILNADVGIGVHALIGLDGLEDLTQVSPYLRMYFGKDYASGFFLEGFIPITGSEETITKYDNAGNFIESRGSRETTVGFGVGLGGKWMLKKNMIFELGGGVGRRFYYDGDDEPITGKWMIGVGYRF